MLVCPSTSRLPPLSRWISHFHESHVLKSHSHIICVITGSTASHLVVSELPHSSHGPNVLPGVQRTWTRLLAGESGVVSTRPLGEEFRRLPSQVAGLVPLGKLKDGCWDASEHVSKDVSTFARFFLPPLYFGGSGNPKLSCYICKIVD